MSLCRSCKAPIQWITTPQGKAAPLDVLPSFEGKGWYWSEEEEKWSLEQGSAERPIYLSHHATCPQGAQWKKKK